MKFLCLIEDDFDLLMLKFSDVKLFLRSKKEGKNVKCEDIFYIS